jgi:hypothetical protein
MNMRWPLILGTLVASITLVRFSSAQEAAEDSAGPSAEAAAPAEDSSADAPNPLLTRQEQIAERFRELERLLLRMAELTESTDPRRAALLRQTVAQSKERAIEDQFGALIELLKKERFSPAVKGQQEIRDDLMRLLELMLSEDRSKHIESEKERVRKYLERVNKIIKEQRQVQGATQRDDDAKQLAERQGEIKEKTGELAQDVRKDEEARAPTKQPAESDSDDSRPNNGKSGEPNEDKKSDSENANGEKSDNEDSQEKSDSDGDQKDDGEKAESDQGKSEKSDGKKSESKQAESQKSEGQKSQGKDSQSKPGDGPPPVDPPQPGESGKSGESQESEQNPAEQRLQRAQQRMQEAQKKLEEAEKSDAVEKQEEALRELEQAKAELEEILRQLREEEMARTLAMLEARFRKMLDAQVQIYEGTQRLDKVPTEDRDRDDVIEAGRLSRKEGEIVVEAEKALSMLQEEGSAVAFPEAVSEIRDDMISIRDRLAEANTGAITQGVEEDVIAALEEMITALEKAQKDMQDQKPGQPGQGGGEQEMPLVDTIAELKMIRAMQMRVNNRTQRYTELTKDEQASEPLILKALEELAERESRIHKITRDIVVGRNR